MRKASSGLMRYSALGGEIEQEDVIEGMMAVSVDATKVREKLGEEILGLRMPRLPLSQR